jgi:hypothetical protein
MTATPVREIIARRRLSLEVFRARLKFVELNNAVARYQIEKYEEYPKRALIKGDQGRAI